jgi:hypothetical protein
MLDSIFQAVSDGNYPLFKGTIQIDRPLKNIPFCVLPDRLLIFSVPALVMMLGTGTGSLKETVESLTVEDPRMPGVQGYNALHLAAIRGGRLDMCRYLVEEIGVDVNCTDKEG